jgi:hypothetical protein
MKTNREKNTEFDTAQTERVRPKQPEYNYKPLEEVIRKWVEASNK